MSFNTRSEMKKAGWVHLRPQNVYIKMHPVGYLTVRCLIRKNDDGQWIGWVEQRGAHVSANIGPFAYLYDAWLVTTRVAHQLTDQDIARKKGEGC